jgi:Predicted neuraminidase (sialidase)
MQYDVLSREFVFRQGPTAMCHGSTVLPLPDGAVLAAWFGGSREGREDTAVWHARRDACGVWSTPCSLPHLPEAHWNPVLRRGADGVVHLYYKVGNRIADWRTYVCASSDNGLTWSVPRELAPGDGSGGRGPVRNKVVRLASGRLLAPASTERGVWTAFTDISDDDGATWRAGACTGIPGLAYTSGERTAEGHAIAVDEQSFYGRGVIQPSVWEDGRGAHMLLRSTEGFIYRSDSTDAGETWTPARPTTLPNNNSGLDLAPANGRLFLACNPVEANWGARSPLVLLASDDNGETWQPMLTLESGAGEFAYPAVVADNNTLHITYTWKRSTIAYWRVNILDQQDLGGCSPPKPPRQGE